MQLKLVAGVTGVCAAGRGLAERSVGRRPRPRVAGPFRGIPRQQPCPQDSVAALLGGQAEAEQWFDMLDQGAVLAWRVGLAADHESTALEAQRHAVTSCPAAKLVRCLHNEYFNSNRDTRKNDMCDSQSAPPAGPP